MIEEQCDVLDKDGNKTGQVLPKSEVHDKELWHGSAFIWIYNSRGELLLQFRAADKKLYSSVWDVSVAGHISAGDNPFTTAIREAKEEIGVAVNPKELKLLLDCKDEAKTPAGKMHREHDWIYGLKVDIAKEQLTLQESEVTNAKWISVSQLEADLRRPDWKKFYAGRNQDIYNVAIKYVKEMIVR